MSVTVETKGGSNWKPSKTAKYEEIKHVVKFDDIGSGEFQEQAIQTGIDKSNPSIMLISSALVHFTTFIDPSKTSRMRQIAYIGRNPDEVIVDPSAGNSLLTVSPDKALAYTSVAGGGQIYPLKMFLMGMPLYEEEIVVGMGAGTEETQISEAEHLKGTVIITLRKYKATEKVWLETALQETNTNRFI